MSRPAATIGGLALCAAHRSVDHLAVDPVHRDVRVDGADARRGLTVHARASVALPPAVAARHGRRMGTARRGALQCGPADSVTAALATYLSARAAIELRSRWGSRPTAGRGDRRPAGRLAAAGERGVPPAAPGVRADHLPRARVLTAPRRSRFSSGGHPGSARVLGPAIGPNTPLGIRRNPGPLRRSVILASRSRACSRGDSGPSPSRSRCSVVLLPACAAGRGAPSAGMSRPRRPATCTCISRTGCRSPCSATLPLSGPTALNPGSARPRRSAPDC